MAMYQLELTPITPLHIGSGEELPGYAYLLDDFWYVYSIDRVLEALPGAARQELVEVATTDIMALAEALQAYPDVLKRVADSVGGYSEDARLKWEDARRNRSQALAQRFIHSQNRIYIPGSSLKGFIRTALLFAYMAPLHRQRAGRDAKELEAETFAYNERAIGSDPFRFLKVSDTDVLRDATDLRMLRRYAFHKVEGRWQEQIETLAECTQASLGRLQRADQEITLHATLTIAEDAHAAAAKDGATPWRFGVQAILEACRHFTQQQLEAERNYAAGLHGLEGAYEALADHAAALPSHATLIRLGFATGRDSKTVNYAQPHPEESVSRVLVDGVWPLGWLELRVLTMEGHPFTPAADLPWKVPAIRRKTRNTGRIEQERLDLMEAQRKAERRAQEAEKHAQERQHDLANDVMAFLRRKQGGEEE